MLEVRLVGCEVAPKALVVGVLLSLMIRSASTAVLACCITEHHAGNTVHTRYTSSPPAPV